jgi:hypothetical protein
MQRFKGSDTKFVWIGVALFVGIVGSHLFAAITRYDSWPVSTYSMFSHPESIETTKQYGIIGIDSEGRNVRVPFGSSKWHTIVLSAAHSDGNIEGLKNSMTLLYKNAVKEQKVAANLQYLQLVTFQGKYSNSNSLEVSYEVNYKFKL